MTVPDPTATMHARLTALYQSASGSAPPPAGLCAIARAPGNHTDIARATVWAHGTLTTSDELLARLADDLSTAVRHRAPWQDLTAIVLTLHTLTDPTEVDPGELDTTRYAVLVAEPDGLALPGEPGVRAEIEQLTLALRRAGSRRPVQLTTVRRLVTATASEGPEPPAEWIRAAARIAGQVAAAVAQSVIDGSAPSRRLPDTTDDLDCAGIGVTLHARTALGCFTAWRGSLRQRLDRAFADALADPRLRRAGSPRPIAVSITLIGPGRHYTGPAAAFYDAFSPGSEVITARQDRRFAVFLDGVPIVESWTRETTLQALKAKAGIEAGPATWGAHQAVTVVHQDGVTRRVQEGFPARDDRPGSLTAWAERIDTEILRRAGYIARAIRAGRTLPDYSCAPVRGRRRVTGSLVRRLFALHALGMAGRRTNQPAHRAAAERGLDACLDALRWSRSGPSLTVDDDHGDTYALVALLRMGNDHAPHDERIRRLGAFLADHLTRPDGRIAPPGRDPAAEDHNYLPGSALEGLARWSAAHDGPTFEKTLDWYADRARQVTTWGMAGWLPQACAGLHAIGTPGAADLGFTVADWALRRQLRIDGAFLTDVSPGVPSFHTACTAEGVAAAWHIATVTGDAERRTRYAHSWVAAMDFMQRLTLHEKDRYELRDREAVGGVRMSTRSSIVRIDAVGHALFALLAGAARIDAESV